MKGMTPPANRTCTHKEWGFVDPGGNHLHIIRNETSVEADTIAVQLIPATQARRIDAADPGNCHF